jgi:PAS domain S-box-containing protein
MERFENLTDSLNSSSSDDVSVLLDELRKARVGKRVADNINKLNEIIQKNIAERKRNETVLKEVVSCYRRLEKNIPGMVYTHIIHADGRQTLPYVTSACRDLFDIEPQDLMKNANLVFELIHPDDKARRDQALNQMVETLRPGREILRHIVQGKTRWYDCMARPELQPNGDVLLHGIVLEITDHKQVEEALRENEERLRIANEAARIGTYATNLEADKVFWSPELCDILGVQPGTERTNEEAFKVVHPDDRDRSLAVSRRALDPDGDGRFSSEHRIVRPDGQVRWILWRGAHYFVRRPPVKSHRKGSEPALTSPSAKKWKRCCGLRSRNSP